MPEKYDLGLEAPAQKTNLPNHAEDFKSGVLPPPPLSLNRLHGGERLYIAPSVHSQFLNRQYGGEHLKANATVILEPPNRLNGGEKEPEPHQELQASLNRLLDSERCFPHLT